MQQLHLTLPTLSLSSLTMYLKPIDQYVFPWPFWPTALPPCLHFKCEEVSSAAELFQASYSLPGKTGGGRSICICQNVSLLQWSSISSSNQSREMTKGKPMPKCKTGVRAWVRMNALLTRWWSEDLNGVGGLLVLGTDLFCEVLDQISFAVVKSLSLKFHRHPLQVRCSTENQGCETPHVRSGPEDNYWERLRTVNTKRERKQDWP